MNHAKLWLLVLVAGCAGSGPKRPVAGPAAPAASTLSPSVSAWAKGALILPDLGPLHRSITTSSKDAQAYFDQGMRLLYGFNHDEATRSFAQAATLDPQCASCFWGVSFTLGPNYNVPMLPDRAQAAWDALQQARALAPRASAVEQALIAALAQRYKGPAPVDPPAMAPFNAAYAAAMREVARSYPADDDVQLLFAESLMNLDPWKLWSLDGVPAKDTPEIVRTLETVLARSPQHPGANHYYIHAIEASREPGKATPSADRLAALMPGAGHVVHMPAHIYQRTGRYADAAETNRKAIASDARYFQRTQAPGYYAMYFSHNHGFLAYAASMLGRAQETIESARAAAKAIPPEMLSMMPGMDYFLSEHLFALVRFARWDELLAEPRPPGKYQVMTTLWLHAHAMALASRGKLDEARQEHAELLALAGKMPADLMAGLTSAADVARLAAKIVEARIAEAKKAPGTLALWAEAVALEDRTAYAEPADWFYPVRHFHGAALLKAGKAADAEKVYREDLRRNPNNGWALFGLGQALRAQKKTKDAAEVDKQFTEAWKLADVKLTASVL